MKNLLIAPLALLFLACSTDSGPPQPEFPERTTFIEFMVTSSGTRPIWADDLGRLISRGGQITQVGDALRTDSAAHIMEDFGFSNVSGYQSSEDRVSFNGWKIVLFEDYSVTCIGPTWAGFFPAPFTTP